MIQSVLFTPCFIIGLSLDIFMQHLPAIISHGIVTKGGLQKPRLKRSLRWGNPLPPSLARLKTRVFGDCLKMVYCFPSTIYFPPCQVSCIACKIRQSDINYAILMYSTSDTSAIVNSSAGLISATASRQHLFFMLSLLLRAFLHTSSASFAYFSSLSMPM